MITVEQIRSSHAVGADYEATEKLKARLAQIRQERNPFYLTSEEFEEILMWKLDRQIGRQRELRKANTSELIEKVTALALNPLHPDKEYELELRVNILCSLRGVGVPVASAVLALVFPEQYPVIDFRGWRQVFDEECTMFSVPDYKKYTQKIMGLAKELGWSVQEVDHAIWEYDRQFGK